MIRYPKRKIILSKKEYLSDDFLRLTFRITDLNDLPKDLFGSHIKIFPFNDDYMKSYTIGSHEKDMISVDIVAHKGRASQWAQNVELGSEAFMWGPKKEKSLPLNLKANNFFLVSDLSGYSTMKWILNNIDKESVGVLFFKTKKELEFQNFSNIKIFQKESLNFDEIMNFFKNDMESFVIHDLETITFLKEKNPKLNVKAYWR